MAFDHEEFWLQLHQLPMAFMNKECCIHIGNSVGKIINVDVPEDGVGWGEFLRIKVEICLTKKIARGRMINVRGNREWIPIQYEKLPKICFKCGQIVHISGNCSGEGGKSSETEGKTAQFRPWLHADALQRKRSNVHAEGSFFRTGKNSSSSCWRTTYPLQSHNAGGNLKFNVDRNVLAEDNGDSENQGERFHHM
ncbi:uncharacterized protein At4g02000-like [Juglans microcarpa x Juglans regia]|uniref:uncharacterized protein At4g02000-like n=1 Tax=Juglans microcarpa x Juglans regia TaxID=2249226 RepID=UPI001B7DAE02|nr:uncharacterized protein At4g02000-like [Juglans microcarpa x Juglans regia]